jgi:4-hydroxy-3-polyprenylbenzoate decarboxylase
VFAIRETPLHLVHLRTMTAFAEIGSIIAPLAPAFYTRPNSVTDIVDQSAGRLLDLFGIETAAVQRWEGGRKERN